MSLAEVQVLRAKVADCGSVAGQEAGAAAGEQAGASIDLMWVTQEVTASIHQDRKVL